MTVYRVWIWMASNEYSGHENGGIMERIAREALMRHRDKITPTSSVIVEVQEHGGWWLHYTVNPDTLTPADKLVIVGTANDCANLSAEAKRWGERWKGATTGGVLESVRRGEEATAA